VRGFSAILLILSGNAPLLDRAPPQRPIIVQRYGGFEVWNIKRITTLEAVVKYHIWEQEKNCALIAKQSRLMGRPVDGFCMIIDVADMGMNKITREFLWLVQRIAEVRCYSTHRPTKSSPPSSDG
jgi:hypothetical protein